MMDFISDDFKIAWFKSVITLLPLFLVCFGLGGFYHAPGTPPGWTITGSIEFGKMLANTIIGNIFFWGVAIAFTKLVFSFWHLFD